MSEVIDNFDYYYQQYVNTQFNKEINIDTSHRCLLECKFCIRQNINLGKETVRSHGVLYGDITPNHAKQMANNWKQLNFCGQISDPIYHQDLFSILQSINTTNLEVLQIHTNGSGKSKTWWKYFLEYVSTASYKTKIIFGIDGIDQKTSYHRKNQDFDQAYEAMIYLAKNDIDVIWQFIPFKYNQHEILKAAEMALNNGISFQLLKSSRFDRIDKKQEIGMAVKPTISQLEEIDVITFSNTPLIKNNDHLSNLKRILNA